MTRPKQTLVTTHRHLPQRIVKLLGPRFNDENTHIPLSLIAKDTTIETYCVYLWATKSNPMPFFMGIGTEFQAYEQFHRYPNGKYTVSQMFRNIVGNNFLCLVIDRYMTKDYAQSLFHYMYKHLTGHNDPTHKDMLFTMAQPEWLPEAAREYIVETHFPTLPALDIEQLTLLQKQKRILQEKLLVQRRNSKLYKEYQEQRKEVLNELSPPTNPNLSS